MKLEKYANAVANCREIDKPQLIAALQRTLDRLDLKAGGHLFQFVGGGDTASINRVIHWANGLCPLSNFDPIGDCPADASPSARQRWTSLQNARQISRVGMQRQHDCLCAMVAHLTHVPEPEPQVVEVIDAVYEEKPAIDESVLRALKKAEIASIEDAFELVQSGEKIPGFGPVMMGRLTSEFDRLGFSSVSAD